MCPTLLVPADPESPLTLVVWGLSRLWATVRTIHHEPVDMTLVGRCAALSVAAEARRRSRARRTDQPGTPQQPLSDYLAAETAALVAAAPEDRALSLEALREHHDEAERAACRRRELRRR